MAVKTGGGLRTISWVITEEQYRNVLAIVHHRRARNPHQRVSQSDIAREALSIGVAAISQADNIALDASANDDTEEPAA